VNSAGAVIAQYAQGPNIDEPLAIQQGTTTVYYEADGLGSVSSLTASNGTTAQTYTYDSFGNSVNSSGSLTNYLRYTAREFDTETNLQFSRGRYYDPASGRFISQDPIGFKGGVNFYEYAKNHATLLRDPFGTFPEPGLGPKPQPFPPGPPPRFPGIGEPDPIIEPEPLPEPNPIILILFDYWLLQHDMHEAQRLCLAYGLNWCSPAPNPSPNPAPQQKCVSGRLSKCSAIGYDKRLLGCKYVCDDGTIWFQGGSCIDPLYKPWGEGIPKYPPIPTYQQ
jgi:RHS repeat-associated protein